MTHILFAKTYDSESMVDMGRDVSECFDSRFNTYAQGLNEDSLVHVSFIFDHMIKNVVMHDKTYDMQSINDIEENLHDSLTQLEVSDIPEYQGFFEGDLILKITYTN